jgi:hypothetical protein
VKRNAADGLFTQPSMMVSSAAAGRKSLGHEHFRVPANHHAIESLVSASAFIFFSLFSPYLRFIP